jgi:hypothetical protein
MSLTPTGFNPFPNAPKVPDGKAFWGENGFSLGDLWDAVNPLSKAGFLQAQPEESGPSQGAKLLGSVLLGGPIGLLGFITNAIVAQETGADIPTHLVNAVTGRQAAAAYQAAPSEPTQHVTA